MTNDLGGFRLDCLVWHDEGGETTGTNFGNSSQQIRINGSINHKKIYSRDSLP